MTCLSHHQIHITDSIGYAVLKSYIVSLISLNVTSVLTFRPSFLVNACIWHSHSSIAHISEFFQTAKVTSVRLDLNQNTYFFKKSNALIYVCEINRHTICKKINKSNLDLSIKQIYLSCPYIPNKKRQSNLSFFVLVIYKIILLLL